MSESTGSPPSLWARYCGGMTARDRQNQARYTAILFAWAVAYLGGTILIESGRVSGGPLVWLTAAVPSVLALFAAMAYWRFLRQTDELQRAIELQALALALGAGFVTWPLFELIAESGAEIGDWADVPILAMIVFYVIGRLLGQRRFA